MTIACVLRSGGDFSPEWVWALRRGLNRHLPNSFDFRCLTDVPAIGIWGIPLRFHWPRWWAKLELFRPGLFEGPVLYLDLDSLPVGDLSDIAGYEGPLAMLSDFYRPAVAQSGVMAFTPGDATAAVWEAFSLDPQKAMGRFRGDGEFIRAHATPDRLQELYPGQIVSLKAKAKRAAPPGARLVCGHGRPRLSDPMAGWAHHEWRRMA